MFTANTSVNKKLHETEKHPDLMCFSMSARCQTLHAATPHACHDPPQNLEPSARSPDDATFSFALNDIFELDCWYFKTPKEWLTYNVLKEFTVSLLK